MDTVRERILKQWVRNLSGLGIFETITRTPLDMQDFAGDYAASLIDEGETVAVYEVGFMQWDMVISVEFYVRMMEGTDPSSELNRIAGLITKEFLTKINTIEMTTNDYLSLNIKPGTLQFEIDGPTDKYVAGVRQFVITYRHDKQDPYTLR